MGTGHTRGILQFVRLCIFGEVQLEPQYTLVCMKRLYLVPWNSSRIIMGVANANFLHYYTQYYHGGCKRQYPWLLINELQWVRSLDQFQGNEQSRNTARRLCFGPETEEE